MSPTSCQTAPPRIRAAHSNHLSAVAQYDSGQGFSFALRIESRTGLRADPPPWHLAQCPAQETMSGPWGASVAWPPFPIRTDNDHAFKSRRRILASCAAVQSRRNGGQSSSRGLDDAGILHRGGAFGQRFPISPGVLPVDAGLESLDRKGRNRPDRSDARRDATVIAGPPGRKNEEKLRRFRRRPL